MNKGIGMDMDVDAKGLKLKRKFVKLWRKVVQSKRSGSHFTPNNETEWVDTCSRETSLPVITSPSVHSDLSEKDEEQVHCLHTGHGEASGSCSNLLVRTKRHIVRHFSSRRIGFVEENEKKSGNPPKDVPKGFVAVYVGDGQEEQTRFVIPVFYFNHPLFLHLLEETEHVYGFNQKGVFTIPCQVSDFEYLQWLIDRERAQDSTR
jgi:SAUR family protein